MTLSAGLRRHWLSALPFLGVVALLVAPLNEDGPTLCPFALSTGVACPGCGLTRAAAWMVRGEVGTALAYHPLLGVVAAWMAGAWAVALARRSGYRITLDSRLVHRLLVATALLFVATWLVRLATGSLPPV